jgi:hypothetical protein
VPGSLEAAVLETISVKLHDENYITSGADTSDPHLRIGAYPAAVCLMGVHFMGVHLIGVHLIDIHFMGMISIPRVALTEISTP